MVEAFEVELVDPKRTVQVRVGDTVVGKGSSGGEKLYEGVVVALRGEDGDYPCFLVDVPDYSRATLLYCRHIVDHTPKETPVLADAIMAGRGLSSPADLLILDDPVRFPTKEAAEEEWQKNLASELMKWPIAPAMASLGSSDVPLKIFASSNVVRRARARLVLSLVDEDLFEDEGGRRVVESVDVVVEGRKVLDGKIPKDRVERTREVPGWEWFGLAIEWDAGTLPLRDGELASINCMTLVHPETEEPVYEREIDLVTLDSESPVRFKQDDPRKVFDLAAGLSLLPEVPPLEQTITFGGP